MAFANSPVFHSDALSGSESIYYPKNIKEEINQSLIEASCTTVKEEVSLDCTDSSSSALKKKVNQSLTEEKQNIRISTTTAVQELSQNFIESDSSVGDIQTNYKKLGMSTNIASKLSELNEQPFNSEQEPTEHQKSANAYEKISSLKQHSKKNYGVRATPKQVFPNIACLPTEDNLVYCFLLSVWDNIVGPQTVYVWKKKSRYKLFPVENNEKLEPGIKSQFKHGLYSSLPEDIRNGSGSSQVQPNNFDGNAERKDCDNRNPSSNSKHLCLSTVVKYVTEHTVGIGESTHWKPNKMASYFLTVPQQGIIVQYIRFSVMEEAIAVPYCLSAVIPIEEEPLFLPVYDLMKDSLYRISAKIRLLITKDGLAGGDKIRSDLQEICATLISLRRAGLNLYPLGTLARIPDDRRMAERMLTSHLQTMCTSLVIANSPNEANRVVMWLGQFLSEEELSVSRIALSDIFWPFQPGLSVQAVIRDPSGSIDLSSSKLLASSRPLTLIDLSTNSVRQMAAMNVHSKNSYATFRMQLMALWHDLDHVPAPSQSLFEPVEAAAPLVKKFLHEWDTLASCEPSVKKLYLNAFLRSLQYFALAIVTWARYEWNRENRRKDSKSILQALSSTFLLEEPDIKIILAQAEKLQPGFLSTLCQKSVKE